MDDDSELTTRFRCGDEAAVRVIYQRYGGDVCRRNVDAAQP